MAKTVQAWAVQDGWGSHVEIIYGDPQHGQWFTVTDGNLSYMIWEPFDSQRPQDVVEPPLPRVQDVVEPSPKDRLISRIAKAIRGS